MDPEKYPPYHCVKLILETEYDVDPRTAYRYAMPIREGVYTPTGWGSE